MWKPIDSAPRDGRLFYVITAGMNIPVLAKWEDRWESVRIYLAGGAQEFTVNVANPTHWMPIPDPPEA